MSLLEPPDGSPGRQPAPTRRERLLVRLMADRLDRALIAGVPPETSRILSVRAHVLVGRRHRRALARCLEAVVDEANGVVHPTVRTAPVQRAAVRAAAADLSALAQRLSAKDEVPARCVAIVHTLVTDGTGPMYNPHRAAALPVVTRSALEAANA